MAQNWNKPKTEVFSPKPAHNPPKSSNDINLLKPIRLAVFNGKEIIMNIGQSKPNGWK